MPKLKLRGRDLEKIGYPSGIKKMAINIMRTHYKRTSKNNALNILQRIYDQPEAYKNDEIFSDMAQELVKLKSRKPSSVIPATENGNMLTFDLSPKRQEYVIYGENEIEAGAKQQMEVAMQLPITMAGALMPDAHQGYGLPIGGVLATKKAVIPYGVGVDIGCRMCMTLYDLPPSFIDRKRDLLKQILLDNTRFGRAEFNVPIDAPVFERAEFREIHVLKELKDRAYAQVGTSGGGNHFVEFGITEIKDPDNEFNLAPGLYLALLSHSGSRGLGAEIARHYTQLAKKTCQLPKGATNLAWLDLNTEEGQEYWLAMNLAGDYASTNHHQIHQRVAKALGESHLVMIENHHNFAWKEKLINGEEVIVHRKGATPASKNSIGIIPGSMTSPGFIIRGKGNNASINSSSHGAGRVMSRSQAKKTITPKMIQDVLKKASVDLIGGGLDEAPMVYKNIHRVMEYQKDLVEVIGSFTPKIVRME